LIQNGFSIRFMSQLQLSGEDEFPREGGFMECLQWTVTLELRALVYRPEAVY